MTGAEVSTPSDRPGRPGALELTLLGAVILAGAAVRLSHPGVGFLNMYAARDLFRTLEMIHGEAFHTSGAEMLYGGRTLGWFLYALLSPPLAISPSPLGVQLWIGILSSLALVVCHVALRRLFGVGVALTVTALWAGSPIAVMMARHLWNPAFLPLFNALALLFLILWRVERRRWAFGAFLVVWGLAIQIHFSIWVHLIALLVLRPWRRDRRPGWWPILGAVLVLAPFLGPHFAREIASGWDNVRSIREQTTGFAQVPISNMFSAKINPTALSQLRRHLKVDLDETIHFPGPEGGEIEVPHYTNFISVMDTLRDENTPALPLALAVDTVSWIMVPLFALGMAALAVVIVGWPRRFAKSLGEMVVVPSAARDFALVIWIWLVGTFLVLAFLKLEGFPYRRAVPSRYFQIWYPVHFIPMALGLRLAAQGVSRLWRGASAPASGLHWRHRLGFLAGAIVAILFVSQAALAWHMLHTKARTGVAFYHTGRRGQPVANVGDKMRLAEILVTERGLNLPAFRERLTTDGLYASEWHEEYIDCEMRAQPLFTTQPDPPPDIRYHIMEGARGCFPYPSDAIEILHVDDVGLLRAVTFRLTDPDLVIPRQIMENGYIW
jgi:hypothetical protein